MQSSVEQRRRERQRIRAVGVAKGRLAFPTLRRVVPEAVGDEMRHDASALRQPLLSRCLHFFFPAFVDDTCRALPAGHETHAELEQHVGRPSAEVDDARLRAAYSLVYGMGYEPGRIQFEAS